MTPTTAGPVLMPIRKIGQPGCAHGDVSRDRRGSPSRHAPPAAAWSGWSPAALKTVRTPSPAKCSIVPPARSTIGHDRRPVGVQHLHDLARLVALAERREPGEVREHRGDDALVADRRDGRGRAAAADAFGDDGRQVRAEAGVEPADLARRLREERQLLVGGALAAELGEHVVRRATARPARPRPRPRRTRTSDRRAPASPRGTARRTRRSASRAAGTRCAPRARWSGTRPAAGGATPTS